MFKTAYSEDGEPLRQFAEVGQLQLQCGKVLPRARVGYCVFQEREGLPLVLVLPALTGSAKAYTPNRKAGESQGDGWWSGCIGPGKFLDTTEFTLLCVDHLGGPPQPDGAQTTSADELQDIGIQPDELRTQDEVSLLVKFLNGHNINQIHAVVGGSMVGGHIYQWLFQNEIEVKHLFDISGCGFSSAKSREFFKIQADLLLRKNSSGVPLHERLREDLCDLGRASPLFDSIREHVLFELKQAERVGYSQRERLMLARKIGFMRFVTPRFFEYRAEKAGLEIGSVAAERTLIDWLDEKGRTFTSRFSSSALAALCNIIATTNRYSTKEIAHRLIETGTHLTGFFVRGDILFPAELQADFYHQISEELPGDQQDLAFVYCVSDPIRGHDHFLSPQFVESSMPLKSRLEGLTVHALANGEHLGVQLPLDADATSVTLPLWQDVVDYEMQKPRVVSVVKSGYPRFVFHPDVRKLFREGKRVLALDQEDLLVLPAQSVAVRCQELLALEGFVSSSVHKLTRADRAADSEAQDKSSTPRQVNTSITDPVAELLPSDNDDALWVTLAPRAAEPTLKAFWQHSGEIVSSRRARAFLSGRKYESKRHRIAYQAVRRKLSAITGRAEEDIYLYPTGMAAFYHAYRVVRRLATAPETNRRSFQLGFAYVDALKVQERLGYSISLETDMGEGAYERLADAIAKDELSAVFTEAPSNPLLFTYDLKRVRKILGGSGVPLVIDDTIAALVNLDLNPLADLAITSLTKFFSGEGRAMGGALWVNPHGELYSKLKPLIEESFEDLCWWEDLECLARDSQQSPEWIFKANSTALQLADFLIHHPAVKRIFYPKFATVGYYQSLMKIGGGYGALLSIVLAGGEAAAARFFDRLKVNKGPGLGTRFTLACPYTLLAHYHELPWVASLGIPPELVRVSVGLEEPEELIERFREALES